MNQLGGRAEIVKLGRLLGLAPQKLEFLQAVDPLAIRALREQMSDALFDDARSRLQRVAAASRLLPAGINAMIGEKVFGAMLCARVAGLLPAEQALETARKLPTGFLADVSLELDPRSAKGVIARLPAEQVVAIAQELIKRREFVVMARFVDYLLDSTLETVIHAIHDDAVLLQIASFLESPQRIDQIVGFMSPARLASLIQTAASGGADTDGYWDEALGLMAAVGDKTRKKLADLAAQQDDAVLGSMLKAVQMQDLWDVLLPIINSMGESAQQRLTQFALTQGVKPKLLRQKARSLGLSAQLETMLAKAG
ncbi:MAG: hypothetical protein ACRETN_12725 [Nevskiales bacterium]